MSLILDALNRSEKERSTGNTVPGLATEHYLDEAATVPGWRQYLPWLALFAALLVIGWLVWGRFSDLPPSQGQSAPVSAAPVVRAPAEPAQEQAQAEAPVAVNEAAAQARKPAAPAAAVAAPVAETGVAIPEDVKALYGQGDSSDAVAEAPPSTAAEPVAEPQPDPVESMPDAAPAALADAVSEEALDIEALVTRAENEVENARLAEHPAPFLASLSQQKKDQIPTLMYSRHDYASDAKTSAVTINGKSLRAGGNAGGGVKVVEVLSDSVVLSHQGTEFRLRALNSWVNL